LGGKKNDTRNDGCLQAVKVICAHASGTARASWLFCRDVSGAQTSQNQSPAKRLLLNNRAHTHSQAHTYTQKISLCSAENDLHKQTHTHTHSRIYKCSGHFFAWCRNAAHPHAYTHTNILSHKHRHTHIYTHTHTNAVGIFCLMSNCSTHTRKCSGYLFVRCQTAAHTHTLAVGTLCVMPSCGHFGTTQKVPAAFFVRASSK